MRIRNDRDDYKPGRRLPDHAPYTRTDNREKARSACRFCAFGLIWRNEFASLRGDHTCMSADADTLFLLNDPDLTVGRMMEIWPQTIAVFMRHNMRCVGCPARRFCTVIETCRIYDLSPAAFLSEIRTAIT